MTCTRELEMVLGRWSIPLRAARHDMTVSGSPERTLYRVVLEDREGQCWLLEKIPIHLKHSKLDIIHLLEYLRPSGFKYALPYRPTTSGDYHAEAEDGLWQLLPFVNGMHLDRPRYVFNPWRGHCIAECLLSLRKASMGFRIPDGRHFFSITDYITEMMEKIARHNPDLTAPVAPVLAYLKTAFFKQHDALPTALCHGDYHPLNLIWSPDDVIAVIDWEFFGLKPEAYDVANMLGCLGMEDPDSLSGEMVQSFLSELKAGRFLSDESWASLLDLTLAIRFAWLAEWLRKSDVEMIELELTYMYLLMDNRDRIKTLWGI